MMLKIVNNDDLRQIMTFHIAIRKKFTMSDLC